MASNYNSKDFLSLPKSNESNIIAHHCTHCGHKNYIMITSVNLSNNSTDTRKLNLNISCDENVSENNESNDSLNEEIREKLKITNNESFDREIRKTPSLNSLTNRKSNPFDESLSQSNETKVMKTSPVISNIAFNETQFKNDLKNLIRIPPNSRDGNTIGKYFLNSQKVMSASNSSNISDKVEITNVFSPYKKGKEPKLDKRYVSDRRLLLWFGVKKDILSEMLSNRLFEIPIINGKFGNGYYFSDRVSESIKYCDQNNGFLLLCEVAVGKMFRFGKTKQFSSTPSGFDSIKIVGKYMADKQPLEKYNNEVIVPIGKTVNNPNVSQTEFHYNKYLVFDQKRIEIRFIIEFETE